MMKYNPLSGNFDMVRSKKELGLECRKNQPAHGFVMLGAGNNVPIPSYIDSSGNVAQADALDAQKESFAATFVLDVNNLMYHTNKGSIVQATAHGFAVGDILFLQDGGGIGNTVGSHVQRIYEVIDANNLSYLGDNMYSASQVAKGVAFIRFSSSLNLNTDTSTTLQMDTTPIHNTIPNLVLNTGSIELEAGVYSIFLQASIESLAPRTNVYWECYIDGSPFKMRYGSNYARNASGHRDVGDGARFDLVLNSTSTVEIKSRREARNGTANLILNDAGFETSSLTIEKYS